VIAATGNWPRAWREIAWDRLPPSAAQALRDRLHGAYAPHAYDVVFSLDGADAQGEVWAAGGITWFAEGALTLGEQWPGAGRQPSTGASGARGDRLAAQGETLRQASAVATPTPLRTTLYAWLTVEAPSAFAAQRDARAWLEAALSALTFAYSVNEPAFMPRVRRLALRGVIATGYSTLTSELKREELFRAIAVRDESLMEFTRTYAQLITNASNEATQTDLERRLMRAFAWYRAGRWDPTPVTRFLSYFVALEHLFVGGRVGAKGSLPEKASALVVTWQYVMDKQDLELLKPEAERGVALRQAALENQETSAALDRLIEFRGWRSDVRPFLAPAALAAAVQVLRRGSSAAADFAAQSNALRAFAPVWAAREPRRAHERERWQVILRDLANRRNDVVHEAVVTGPDMELYARRLETIVQRILDRLTDVAINAALTVATVNGAVAWHQDPW